MADAEDIENEGETEVNEIQEENDGEESSPAEEDTEAGDDAGDGEEQDGEDPPDGEEGDEAEENDEAAAAEYNGDEAGETPETEMEEEAVAEDVELEIRDEDEGRPVSSLSKKVSLESENDIKNNMKNIPVRVLRSGSSKCR